MAAQETDWMSVFGSVGNKLLDTGAAAYVSKETAQINADRDVKAIQARAQADRTVTAPQGFSTYIKSPITWVIGGVVAIVGLFLAFKN